MNKRKFVRTLLLLALAFFLGLLVLCWRLYAYESRDDVLNSSYDTRVQSQVLTLSTRDSSLGYDYVIPPGVGTTIYNCGDLANEVVLPEYAVEIDVLIEDVVLSDCEGTLHKYQQGAQTSITYVLNAHKINVGPILVIPTEQSVITAVSQRAIKKSFFEYAVLFFMHERGLLLIIAIVCVVFAYSVSVQSGRTENE